MIFYASAVSSYSAKVRIALEYKGLSYQETPPPNGYKSQAYRQLVPTGRIPALMTEGKIISESEVILEYLEEKYPSPHMLPSHLMARAQVRFYARFHDLYFEPLVRQLFPHINPAQRNAQVVGHAMQAIQSTFHQMNAWPNEDFDFEHGKVSLADCGFLVSIPLATQLLNACGEDLQPPERWVNWWQTGHQIPAVTTALASWKIATQEWILSQTA